MGKFRPLLKWLFVIFATGAIVSLFVVLAWPLPFLLAEDPIKGLTTAERLKAANDVRTTLVSAAAGTIALGSVLVGLRTYRLSQSGQFTDRYSGAVEQLVHEEVTVRLGGIYALERLAKDSVLDRQAVIDVLAAFIRGAATVSDVDGEPAVSPDAQIAMHVIGRRFRGMRNLSLNLSGAKLPQVDLRSFNLARVNLSGCDLSMSRLDDANLSSADLRHADLRGASIAGVNFRDADLSSADLRGANLASTGLTSTQVASARTD